MKPQNGDTIIEVLISIAIVGLILSASYALANRGTQSIQRAQERSEALKLAEQQMERLRSAGSMTAQCFKDNGTTGNNDSECAFGTAGRYTLKISKSSDHYTVTANWERLGGGPTEQLALDYRMN